MEKAEECDRKTMILLAARNVMRERLYSSRRSHVCKLRDLRLRIEEERRRKQSVAHTTEHNTSDKSKVRVREDQTAMRIETKAHRKIGKRSRGRRATSAFSRATSTALTAS